MSEAAGRGLVQGLKEADDQARLWQGSGRASSLDQAVLSGNSSSSSHSTLASLSPSEGLSPSGSGQSDADMDEFSRQRQRTRSDDNGKGGLHQPRRGIDDDGIGGDNMRRLGSVQSHRMPAKFTHQKLDLNATNFTQFHFRGMVVVKNLLEQEYDTFDLVPDELRLQTQGDTSLLEHSIFNIELALRENLAPGDPLKPHSVTLYYFLRASGHDRYDSMLSVTIQVSAIFQELHALFAERAPTEDATALSFEMVEYSNDGEVSMQIGVQWDKDIRNATGAATALGTPYAVIRSVTLRTPLQQQVVPAADVLYVNEPRLSTKTFQNFWFRLEIEKRIDGMTDDTALWGPFIPAEQHINMADSHYYIEQEIVLDSFSVLQGLPSHKHQKSQGNAQVFALRYFVRERGIPDASLFCLAALELPLAAIIQCSLGFQRQRDRFKIEKYVAFGMVRVTFHFYVREELWPQPDAAGPFALPERGNWLLERISIAIRMA